MERTKSPLIPNFKEVENERNRDCISKSKREKIKQNNMEYLETADKHLDSDLSE